MCARAESVWEESDLVSVEIVGPMGEGSDLQPLDADPAETQEWLDSLDAVVEHAGRVRALSSCIACGHGPSSAT